MHEQPHRLCVVTQYMVFTRDVLYEWPSQSIGLVRLAGQFTQDISDEHHVLHNYIKQHITCRTVHESLSSEVCFVSGRDETNFHEANFPICQISPNPHCTLQCAQTKG